MWGLDLDIYNIEQKGWCLLGTIQIQLKNDAIYYLRKPKWQTLKKSKAMININSGQQ